MKTYTVQILDCAPAGIIGGPFTVVVRRLWPNNEPDARLYTVASRTGIRTHADAEQIAMDYRAQFGVAEAQS